MRIDSEVRVRCREYLRNKRDLYKKKGYTTNANRASHHSAITATLNATLTAAVPLCVCVGCCRYNDLMELLSPELRNEVVILVSGRMLSEVKRREMACSTPREMAPPPPPPPPHTVCTPFHS